MTAFRRSQRTRRPAQTVYDDAKKALLDEFTEKSRKNEDDESSKEEIEENEAEAESTKAERGENESSSEESSDEEEAFAPKKAARKGPAKKQKKRPGRPKQIRVGVAPKKPAKKTRAPSGTATNRALQNALTSLARKVLEDSETPENSLVAALLHARKPGQAAARRPQRNLDQDHTTVYTPQLERISRDIVEQLKDDPNKAQTALLNLIFRSVGGSLKNNLDPDEVILQDMDDQEWAQHATILVDDMQHTPADQVLFCTDPDGAVHAAAVDSNKDPAKAVSTASALGVREYRKIYEEFWYVLGSVALSEGVSDSENTQDDDSIEEEDRRRSKTFTSTTRFDAELARDILFRMNEVVTVGQPDIRSAVASAAFNMGHAILDKTLVIDSKLDVAKRQLDAAGGGDKQRGKLSRKAESLKHQVDSLTRNMADLEELTDATIIKGVFMHRYRDSNMHIRAACLNALSKMSLQRPDLFLKDKYLKYFGWMMSDKSASVRIAGVNGLIAPLQALYGEPKRGSKALNGSQNIDIKSMQHVIAKFFTRLVDCVVDVSIPVQEKAMELLQVLMRHGHLDGDDRCFLADLKDGEEEEIDLDPLFRQVNLRALARDTSALVRRDALYFVIEQLEQFDDDEDDGVGRKRNKKASPPQYSERVSANRLNALATWAAQELTDGPIPVEKVQVDLADFIVHSLRDMPEHRSLVTNWPAMLKAVGDDNIAMTRQGNTADDRAAIAKQRILVQMLACAAQAEVRAVADSEFMLRDVDPDFVAATSVGDKEENTNTRKRAKSRTSIDGMPHEVLSVALLKSLPGLLMKFKGDSAVLGSLTSLPRFLLPSVFSLPQRKNDFTGLAKNLADIFLESADSTVLQNTALSLTFLPSGDHARASDGRLQVQRVAATLRDRLMELFDEDFSDAAANEKKRKGRGKQSPSKRRRSGRSSFSSMSSGSDTDDDTTDRTDAADAEYAIYLCLKRLAALSKRCDVADLLETSEDSVDNEIEVLCNSIFSFIAKTLEERKPTFSDGADGEEANTVIPDVWTECDKAVHSAVAKYVNEALAFFLSVTAWKLREAQEDEGVLVQGKEEATEGDDTDASIEDHIVLRLRKQLIALLVLSFDQYLPDSNESDNDEEGTIVYSAEHRAFADSIQLHAGKVSSDLRVLFPKEWGDAANPLLRACALTDDRRLIGGVVRYFRSKEDKMQTSEEKEDVDLVQSLLLPMGRSLCTNWRDGNRREAGFSLSHITGSGKAASDLVGAMSRTMKKVQPVRLLEAHMASLRQSYEEWMEQEPEELESDRPTDEEMKIFEEKEQSHEEMFHTLEQQAARLSMSLGVGKLSDPKLSDPLLGFVKEGVRFAFSNTEIGVVGDVDEELMLGCRLSFLRMLGRYANWIKRNNEHKAALRDYLDEKEATLRADKDFEDVAERDLEALAAFRASLGLKDDKKKEYSPRSVVSPEYDEGEDGDGSGRMNTTPGSSVDRSLSLRRRLSRGSSVGSMRSKLSTQSSLSPLYEEDATMDGSGDEQLSPSPFKMRRVKNSLESNISRSTVGMTQTPIEEGSGESSDDVA